MPQEQITEPYTEKFAYNGSGQTIYRGWARPGIPTSVTNWRIAFYEYDGSGLQTSITWASGSKNFDYEWDERASYSYS